MTRLAVVPAFLFAVSLLLPPGYSQPVPQKTKTDDNSVYWGYEGDIGPRFWGHLSPGCAGRSQSPIDIVKAATEELPAIEFSYKPIQLVMINNGHSIEVSYRNGSSISVGGQTFELERFHFHTPSEHTIRGRRYPMEMHLVHQGAGDGEAVVGVLIELGRHNRALDRMWRKLPKVACLERSLKDITINAADLLPAKRGYYSYDGSLTTPLCTEGVNWFVLKTPIQISLRQLRAFRHLYVKNSRPVQPLNGREVRATKSS
jgi:carbonic anhydrase